MDRTPPSRGPDLPPVAGVAVSALVWVGVGAGVGAVVLVVVLFWIVVRQGHRVGNRGLVQRSRLTCPKCGRTFDYDWVPGAALTAVRLGRGRYMACPICHHWSYFDMLATMRPRSPDPEAAPPSGEGQLP